MTLLVDPHHKLHHRDTEAPRKASEKCETAPYEWLTVVNINQ